MWLLLLPTVMGSHDNFEMLVQLELHKHHTKSDDNTKINYKRGVNLRPIAAFATLRTLLLQFTRVGLRSLVMDIHDFS